jgi:sterol desaturase/sphingolipid hydroxylase (fatty acid hydroxylase superfamily)
MNAVAVDASSDSESIRLFQSDFLEFFTHISPVTIVVVWVPVIAYLLVYSVQTVSGSGFASYIPLGVVVGMVMWTATEYLLHRFLFHYEPSTPQLERIFYLFHGVHHDRPQDKTRLVMPLPVSIPMAFLFYGLFYLVAAVLLQAPEWVMPLMAGFLVGYLTYDLIHYATHHFPMRSGYLKYIKRYHMMHHYKDPEAKFGVSSPIWDFVFRTTGADQ